MRIHSEVIGFEPLFLKAIKSLGSVSTRGREIAFESLLRKGEGIGGS